MAKATVEQVKKEIDALLVRLKDTKIELKDLKEEWPSVQASGDKEQKAEWTKRRDKIDSIRVGLKQDRQALATLVRDNEDLHSLNEKIQELMEF